MRTSDHAKVESLEGVARRVGGGSDNDSGGAVMPVTDGLAPCSVMVFDGTILECMPKDMTGMTQRAQNSSPGGFLVVVSPTGEVFQGNNRHEKTGADISTIRSTHDPLNDPDICQQITDLVFEFESSGRYSVGNDCIGRCFDDTGRFFRDCRCPAGGT